MLPTVATRLRRRFSVRRSRPPGADERGISPVEFAIIASAMFLLTFTVVQVALVYYAHSLALGAATQGVNAARGYQSSAGAGESHARQFLSRAGSGLLDEQVNASRGGEQVTVVVTGRAVSVLPGMTFTVRKSAHGPVERVTTP